MRPILPISALLIFASVAWGQVKTEPGIGRSSLARGDLSTQRGLIEIAQNREPQSPSSQGASQSGAQRPTNAQQPGEWHKFSSPHTTNQGQPMNNSSRPSTTSPRYTSPSGSQGQRPTTNRDYPGNWRHFPSPRSSDQAHPSSQRPVDRPSKPANNTQNDPWRSFTPNDRVGNSAPANRNPGSSYDRGYNGSAQRPTERGNGFQPSPRESRPPLQMGHPVVTPRNSPPPARGGGHSAPPPSNGRPHR